MKTTLQLVRFVLGTSTTLSLHAQTIDFESLPDGLRPTVGMQISNQFAGTFGVTFRMESGAFPRIAMRDDESFLAFEGPPNNTTPNHPVDYQNVGDFFLTGDLGKTFPPIVLVITYEHPVAAASGVILDIDFSDAWQVVARDSNMNAIATIQLNRNSPNADGATAVPWRFARTNADIASIRIAYNGPPDRVVGWALDNFSPKLPTMPGKLFIRRDPSTVFAFGLAGMFGSTYRIEYTDQLPSTNWRTRVTVTLDGAPDMWNAGSGFYDPTISNGVPRFYRAVGF